MKRLDGPRVVYYHAQADGLVFRRQRRFFTCRINMENLEVLEENHSQRAESFFKAIAPVIIMAQCFSLMPVCGVTSADPSTLKFRWFSFRTGFSLVYIAYAFAIDMNLLRGQLKVGLTASNIAGVIFFACATISGVMFFRLARNWPEMAGMWHTREAMFLKSPYKVRGRSLSYRIRRIVVLILVAAFVEHLLYLAVQLNNIEQRRLLCGLTVDNHYEFFVKSNFAFIFEVVPYNFYFSFVLMFFNFSFTFAWNYIDLFMIVQNVSLTVRFQQLNEQVLRFRGRAMHEFFWAEMRTHFVSLCELLEYLDRKMGPVVLFSCFNNLYFICLQLLNIFNKHPNALSYIYFWYSLTYLITRTVCVFGSAASINEAARQVNVVLKDVPTRAMCTELERFTRQARTELVALSGMKLFYMTRPTVLKVAGAIFTYELTMIQLDRRILNGPETDFCG